VERRRHSLRTADALSKFDWPAELTLRGPSSFLTKRIQAARFGS
jgi:hypothetical protein